MLLCVELELAGDRFFSMQRDLFPTVPFTVGIASRQLLMLFKLFLFLFTRFYISCSFAVIIFL